MAYIKVENLKYRYPNTKKLALDDLNFEIEKGSFIGIAGANGAGKSTLCQAFNGLVPGFFKGAYGGRVIIDREETAKVPVSRLCRKSGWYFRTRLISCLVPRRPCLKRSLLVFRTSEFRQMR